jgi:transcriptional regulator with XRE-family HTH domain
MKTTKQLLGARIKELRKRSGISQEQLADRVDVDPKFISFIECGRSAPSLETIENIARALNMEIKELFEFAHLQTGAVDTEELLLLVQESDEGTRKLLLKFMRTLVR